MLRIQALAITAALILAPPASAGAAARCHDASGKFVKCPAPAAATATTATATQKTTARVTAGRCRDDKGHYVKCGAPAAPAAAQATPATAPPQKPSILGGLLGRRTTTTATTTNRTARSVTADATGATAQCKDGSYSHAKTHTGACSRHGGVARWL